MDIGYTIGIIRDLLDEQKGKIKTKRSNGCILLTNVYS